MSCTPVLYAEDITENVSRLEQVLAKTHPGIRLHPVKRAQDAVDYLRDALKPGHFETNPLPKVVVLHARGADTLAALQWIRGRGELASMPVVVMGSPATPAEKQRAFNLGADQYIQENRIYPDLAEQLRLWI